MIIRNRTLDWAVDHVMCCRAYNPIITCVACFTSANPILHARAGELSSAPFPTASTCVGPTKYVLLLPFPFSAWCFHCSTVFSFIIILHIRWDRGRGAACVRRCAGRSQGSHRRHTGGTEAQAAGFERCRAPRGRCLQQHGGPAHPGENWEGYPRARGGRVLILLFPFSFFFQKVTVTDT